MRSYAIGLGPFFIATAKAPKTHRFQKLKFNENEKPYRKGRGPSIRLRGNSALMIGLWHSKLRDETDPDQYAIDGREMTNYDPEDIREWDGGKTMLSAKRTKRVPPTD